MNNFTDYIHITLYVLSVLVVILFILVIKLQVRLKKLTRGNKSNIEEVLSSIEEDLKTFGGFRQDMEKYLKSVESRLRKSVTGLHAQTFKAFDGLDSGGHQSFATAFLNENGDGIILSTLHSRDRVNVYLKKIKEFKSDSKLSDEEALALTKAKESCKL